jgi:hypothetical protein
MDRLEKHGRRLFGGELGHGWRVKFAAYLRINRQTLTNWRTKSCPHVVVLLTEAWERIEELERKVAAYEVIQRGPK